MCSPFFILHWPPGLLVPSKKTNGISNSVALTASCMARNSLRSRSFSAVSLDWEDLVMILGAASEVFAPSRLRSTGLSSWSSS